MLFSRELHHFCHRWQPITHRKGTRSSWVSLAHLPCSRECCSLWGTQSHPNTFGHRGMCRRNHGLRCKVSILACTRALQYRGWKVESEGRTPWEGTQVVAFEILSTLCQQDGDSLNNCAAGSIPQVDPAMAVLR